MGVLRQALPVEQGSAIRINSIRIFHAGPVEDPGALDNCFASREIRGLSGGDSSGLRVLSVVMLAEENILINLEPSCL